MDWKASVTILLPSHERAPLLERAVAYTARHGVPVVVVDSSERPTRAAAEAAHVRYLHRPGEPVMSKMRRAVSLIQTPYTCIMADDDFVSPGGLKYCVHHMLDNAGLGAAIGQYVRFDIPGGKPEFQLMGTDEFIELSTKPDYDDLAIRLRYLFTPKHDQIIYGVNSTTTMQNFYGGRFDFIESASLLELAFGALAAMRGPLKRLPVFYGARQLGRPIHDPAYNYIGNSDILRSSDPRRRDEIEQMLKALVAVAREIDPSVPPETVRRSLMLALDDLARIEEERNRYFAVVDPIRHKRMEENPDLARRAMQPYYVVSNDFNGRLGAYYEIKDALPCYGAEDETRAIYRAIVQSLHWYL